MQSRRLLAVDDCSTELTQRQNVATRQLTRTMLESQLAGYAEVANATEIDGRMAPWPPPPLGKEQLFEAAPIPAQCGVNIPKMEMTRRD